MRYQHGDKVLYRDFTGEVPATVVERVLAYGVREDTLEPPDTGWVWIQVDGVDLDGDARMVRYQDVRRA